MATKTIAHRVKLQLTAGDAAMVELGKMLGPTGVNLVQVKRAYDEATATQRGDVVPAVITVREDRTFELDLKTPPTASLIRKALNGARSTSAGQHATGSLTRRQLREIAKRKLVDLNTDDVEAAMRTIAGTARSMGVTVEQD